MNAKWDDIENALNAGTLEDQDRETLKAFARVEPPPSQNPAFHERFRDAKERIRHRLREMDADDKRVRANSTGGGLGPWFVQVTRLIREMRKKALDAQKTKAKSTIASIKKYLETDYDTLCDQWPKNLKCSQLTDLGRHIGFAQPVDFRDMIEFDLPGIESVAEKHFLSAQPTAPSSGFESLLHPAIQASSYQQFQDGHLRDAVLNSIIGLLDHVRKVSGEKTDGAKLVNDAFGGSAPLLIFSTMDTESGRNDQSGFHKIFLGAVEGIRNPKAHSLAHDLNATKAAQYLVMASLLCRRVDECHPGQGTA